MRTIIDIHYFDYALYRYIECLILPGMPDDTLLYYSKIIRLMKDNLDRREYSMEEEMVAKYAIYLVNEKLLGDPRQEESALDYRGVFKELKLINLKSYHMEKIQLYLLWSYNYLVLRRPDAQAAQFVKLEEFEYQELLAEILTRDLEPQDRSYRLGAGQKEMHLALLKELIYKEIQHSFGRFSEPLLFQATVLQETLHSKENGVSLLQDVDMIAAEFSTIYNTRGIFADMYDDLARPEAHIHTGMFDQHHQGQEIPWNEHSLEQMHKISTMKPSLTYPEGSIEYKGMFIQDRKRRMWTPEEEDRLIKGVLVLGKDWKQIRAKYNFDYLSPQQLKDKHRSLIKSGKMDK